MKWDAARLARLKEMLANGMTASEAAAAFGDVSRNGVMGAAHRAGLTIGGERRAMTISPYAVQAVAEPSRPRGSIEAGLEPEPAPPPETVVADIRPLRLPLARLTATTCRWPLGDPGTADFAFCGLACAITEPYCPAHRRLAYAPRIPPAKTAREAA